MKKSYVACFSSPIMENAGALRVAGSRELLEQWLESQGWVRIPDDEAVDWAEYYLASGDGEGVDPFDPDQDDVAWIQEVVVIEDDGVPPGRAP